MMVAASVPAKAKAARPDLPLTGVTFQAPTRLLHASSEKAYTQSNHADPTR
jgi:hypothetical protein